MTTEPPTTPTQGRTSPWLLVVAWAAVGLPLAWGVYMTLLGRLKLFRTPESAVTAGPPCGGEGFAHPVVQAARGEVGHRQGVHDRQEQHRHGDHHPHQPAALQACMKNSTISTALVTAMARPTGVCHSPRSR